MKNSSGSNSDLPLRRFSANLLLTFGISLPLSFGPQINPGFGAVGKGATIPNLIASGIPPKVDTWPEMDNNAQIEPGHPDRVRIGIAFAGEVFEPQTLNPAAEGRTLIAPEIYQKAKSLGSVRVIVELHLPPHREDSQSSREDAIRMAQKAILDELAKVDFRVIRSYASIPAIVLAASVDALKIIAASGHVTRVTEDGLSIPLKPLGAAK